MSIDYAQKEKDFIDALAEDTGRDLTEWMDLIAAQNLGHRNDIIDWLRQQGFTFSKASWLERIHHNGGKPIYASLPMSGTSQAHSSDEPLENESGSRPPERLSQRNIAARPQLRLVRSGPKTGKDDPLPCRSADVDALLQKAKGMRPLAQYLLREIERVLGDAAIHVEEGHVYIAVGDATCAVLAVAPKELRLGLTLASGPVEPPLEPVRLSLPPARMPPGLTCMVVLDDARQINSQLLALIRRAADVSRNNRH